MKKFFTLIAIMTFCVIPLFSQGVQEEVPSSHFYIDSRGTSIPLNQQINRVVSLSPNVSETIAALGGSELLVGKLIIVTIQNIFNQLKVWEIL